MESAKICYETDTHLVRYLVLYLEKYACYHRFQNVRVRLFEKHHHHKTTKTTAFCKETNKKHEDQSGRTHSSSKLFERFVPHASTPRRWIPGTDHRQRPRPFMHVIPKQFTEDVERLPGRTFSPSTGYDPSHFPGVVLLNDW